MTWTTKVSVGSSRRPAAEKCLDLPRMVESPDDEVPVHSTPAAVRRRATSRAIVGCGVTEDGCTGAVYTNRSADLAELQSRSERFQECVQTYENAMGCATCDRIATPPECRDGLCVGASACALQAAAIWDFKSRNDACQVDDDCVAERIGCEVTEDDCTGAVHFSKTVDREELTLLRDEYWACTGGCSACRRVEIPPACLQGHCVRGPLR